MVDAKAPLMCYFELECQNIDKIFDMNGVFSPLCPFQMSFFGSTVFSEGLDVKNTITNVIFSTAMKFQSNKMPRNINSITVDAAMDVINHKNELGNLFKFKFSAIVSVTPSLVPKEKRKKLLF